jgi:hypothetical protein
VGSLVGSPVKEEVDSIMWNISPNDIM